jgi:hypothetical protein
LSLLSFLLPTTFTNTIEGITINHPVYYDAPEHDEAYTLSQQQTYMFGGSMLVAALSAPGVSLNNRSADLTTNRTVWIPPGEWYSWVQRVAKHVAGPLWVDHSYALDEIPVYVRAGALIPLQGEHALMQGEHRANQTNQTHVKWYLFPPGNAAKCGVQAAVGGVADGSGRNTSDSGGSTACAGVLYEDQGDGLGYRTGKYQLFKATQTWTAPPLTPPTLSDDHGKAVGMVLGV